MIFKGLKVFRHSDVPYTPLVDTETRYIPVVDNTGSSITMEPAPEIKSIDDIPMPLAFQRMRMMHNPMKGQLASLGIFSIMIALCGAPIVASVTLAKLPKRSNSDGAKIEDHQGSQGNSKVSIAEVPKGEFLKSKGSKVKKIKAKKPKAASV